MKVAIVHDDLVQYGGAEKVLSGICDVFPEAPIYTSVFDDRNQDLVDKFGSRKIVTSFLQNIPGWKMLYKAMLPLYPIAFEQFDFSQYDIVISQTTRFAKCIITKPKTKHICYIHTPPRFLWNFSKQKQNVFLKSFLNLMQKWDYIWGQRPDIYLTGSRNAANRIKEVYGRESEVLYPFIDIEEFNLTNFNGGYFVVIARLNEYKRVDLAVKACIISGHNLKIIGQGPEMDYLKSLAKGHCNIQILGRVSDDVLRFILSGATALITPGEEDFGLTALEAQALGKPVVAFKSGGALETVLEKTTGLFFDTQSVDNLVNILDGFKPSNFNSEDCKHNARRFDKEGFVAKLTRFIISVP